MPSPERRVISFLRGVEIQGSTSDTYRVSRTTFERGAHGVTDLRFDSYAAEGMVRFNGSNSNAFADSTVNDKESLVISHARYRGRVPVFYGALGFRVDWEGHLLAIWDSEARTKMLFRGRGYLLDHEDTLSLLSCAPALCRMARDEEDVDMAFHVDIVEHSRKQAPERQVVHSQTGDVVVPVAQPPIRLVRIRNRPKP